MKQMTTGYGPHLTLDLGDCNPVILDDLEACFKLLNELPDLIGMTKITSPYVFRYNSPFPEEDGITGVTIIAESHISLHTYPDKNFAFVDLFSCKPFDVKRAQEFIVNYFESKSAEIHVHERGIHFPKTLHKAS